LCLKVIGAGPSGTDLAIEIAKVAERVTWSHHLKKPPANSNVEQKPDVARLTENGVEFVDGTTQDFSVILYGTGYRYTFPFLSVDCGLSNVDGLLQPLYKFCLSIHRPTLAVIGLPNQVCPNQMFDLQVRFCLKFMTGRKQLPSKEEMLSDFEREVVERRELGFKRGLDNKKAYSMGPGIHEKYYAELAETADIEPIKPVIVKIFAKGLCNLLHEAVFRDVNFRILDDENYEMIGE